MGNLHNKNQITTTFVGSKAFENLVTALNIQEVRMDPTLRDDVKKYVTVDLKKPHNWRVFTSRNFSHKNFRELLLEDTQKNQRSPELRTLQEASTNINRLNSQTPINSVALIYERLRIQYIQSAIVHQYLFDNTTSDAAKFQLLNRLFEKNNIPPIIFYRMLNDITAGVILKRIAASRFQEFRIGSAIEREFKRGDFFIGDQPIILGFYNSSPIHLFEDSESLGNFLLRQLITENQRLLPNIAKDITKLVRFLETSSADEIAAAFSGLGMGKLTQIVKILSKIYLTYKLSQQQNIDGKTPFFMITNGELIKSANGDTWNNQFNEIVKELAPTQHMTGE